MINFREHLSAPGLLKTVRNSFSSVKDWRQTREPDISISDALMSGIAVFGMKYSSLLQFDSQKVDPIISSNLRNLYGVDQSPCDTRLREILDPIDPNHLRPAFKALFARLQDGKALLPFRFIDESYLVSIDGTGFFSSHEVHCENCCVKKSHDGTVTYYHQMLGAVMVHPSQKQVIVLAPEAIIKQDGVTKNDCEINAAKRLLTAIRRDHPFLNITLLGDGLFSNAPMIRQALEAKMGFIFGAKPGDHKSLFASLEDVKNIGAQSSLEHVEGDTIHHFRFMNDVPLNDANPDLLVNVLVYSETRRGKSTTFSWVTHIRLNKDNVYQIMKGGRARWRIENETFNTLKNQGYQFEHNFGHGYRNLSTVFAYLMLLAFLIDQVQELCCPAFQRLLKKEGRRKYAWEKMRSFFLLITAENWEFFYSCLIYGYKANIVPNTS